MNGRCYKCNNPLTTGDFDGMCNDCKKQQNDTEISIVEKALTPPTAEEVCKELSKCLGDNVILFYRDFVATNKNRVVASKFDDGEILIEISLPPHLITLIGRFYEGVEKVGKEDV